MDLSLVKTIIAAWCAASLIVMAFIAMTPATWFLSFCAVPLAWLFGESIVKTGIKMIKGKPMDTPDKG